MAINNLFGLITEKMNYLTQRQQVIASNIANANVAGYRAKDIESFDAVLNRRMSSSGSSGHSLQPAAMRTTDPRHLQGNAGIGGATRFKVSSESDTYEVKPSGNAVDVEQQMTQMAQTTTDYNTVTGLYKKMMAMMKQSIGGK